MAINVDKNLEGAFMTTELRGSIYFETQSLQLWRQEFGGCSCKVGNRMLGTFPL